MEKQDQLLMKKQNRLLVLELLRAMSPISRIQLSKVTKMSPTSITRIVQELQEEGFVRESLIESTSIGRKPTLLELCPDVLYTVGVELDRRIVRVGLVDFLGEFVDFKVFQRKSQESYRETLNNIHEKTLQIINENQIEMKKVIGLGVGLPGSIDYEKGIVKISEQLQWENIPLAEDLKELTNHNIIIDNELKMKIIAENTIGQSIDSDNCILLGIGSGIGAAILLHGEVHRGTSNNAGEIGHTVIDPNGVICHCGKVGCLSTYISESAIIADANKVKPINSIEEVYDAYRSKETWACNIMDRVTTYIALAVSNMACLYEPEYIILSGHLIDELPGIGKFIEEKCDRYIWQSIRQNLKIVYSKLGSEGVVRGAAIQAQKVLLDL
ncbi:ROK family protein [Viridibacillus sp. NPDC093762]|uniref:ROK family transcriptional regulator n=1 Tax=Viridibacillus sp. NPDC093762 TaxID=3390720 RepID=UPI003CFE69F1